jgi:hypothetical protein
MRYYLLILFFLVNLLRAQDLKQLETRIKLTAGDGNRSLELCSSGYFNEFIEGYFVLPEYWGSISGNLRSGGFTFLDPDIFGGITDEESNIWAKNSLPFSDLEHLTNGLNVKKAISFRMKSIYKNSKEDSLYLFIKYAVFDLKEHEENELNFNYNIKLANKLVKVPFDKVITFDFLNKELNNGNIIFNFSKYNNCLFPGYRKNIIDEIIKSAGESSGIAKPIDFELEYECVNPFPAESWKAPIEFKAFHRTVSLFSRKYIFNNFTGNKTNLYSSVYYAELKFPFRMENPEKIKKYKNYITRDSVFQSTFEVFIIPINFEKDSLTLDIIIDYKKLNTGDNVPRWTPVKKRAKVKWFLKIKLPKENWSANIRKDGEKYDIYGYSDFERYIDEYLFLHIKKSDN